MSATTPATWIGPWARVFERAPELAEVGAGLGLWTNALRVLDQLGVGQRIRRTTALVRQSWSFGVPARWAHPWAVRLREALVRITPSRVLIRTMRQHLGYDAGTLPRGGVG